MPLDGYTTKELRSELDKREAAERKAHADRLKAEYPCPECGGDPVTIEDLCVGEHRQAPRDDDGRPILYAPYEMGTVIAREFETTITCVNGHATVKPRMQAATY